MAQPYGKLSRSKKKMRSANKRVALPRPTTCTRCKSPTLPHSVCPVCGYYRNKQMIIIKSDKKKKKKAE